MISVYIYLFNELFYSFNPQEWISTLLGVMLGIILFQSQIHSTVIVEFTPKEWSEFRPQGAGGAPPEIVLEFSMNSQNECKVCKAVIMM